MPDVPVDGWVLRARVPEGIFTLSIEDDDAATASSHAAFADRCLPLLMRAVSDDAEEAAWLRAELISQLGALRQEISASGLGYLGALAGEHDGRPVLVLLGIAATPQAFPDGIDPASLLAAMLRRRYPGSAIEEFATADRVGVGIRRCEAIRYPSARESGLPEVEAGISQALVPFPEAALLGTVTGICLAPQDIDTATVFTATVAHHMTAVPQSLSRGHHYASGPLAGLACCAQEAATAATGRGRPRGLRRSRRQCHLRRLSGRRRPSRPSWAACRHHPRPRCGRRPGVAISANAHLAT